MENFKKHLVKNLEQNWSLYEFDRTFDLFYAGQIPHGALFVKSGTVELIFKGIQKKLLEPASLYFLDNLLEEIPIKFSVRVHPGTAIYLLDKPSLFDHLEQVQATAEQNKQV